LIACQPKELTRLSRIQRELPSGWDENWLGIPRPGFESLVKKMDQFLAWRSGHLPSRDFLPRMIQVSLSSHPLTGQYRKERFRQRLAQGKGRPFTNAG
jgi:hypothetical protein